MNERNESLVMIPGLDDGARVTVESLLQAAGIEYASLPGDFEGAPRRVLVRSSELADVKELLADFRIRTQKGELIPIPW